MSMHKTPLTIIEETGLIAHGMGRDIGKPSQSADVFRAGIAWGLKSTADKIESIKAQLDHDMPFNEKLRERFSELLLELEHHAAVDPHLQTR